MNSSFASPPSQSQPLHFTNRFAALGPAFFSRLKPQALSAPKLLAWSSPVAALLGLNDDATTQTTWTQILAGQQLPAGSDPLASVYSGHQFGVWAGQLGDGRALLLGEVQTPAGYFELQLKGCGPTPYSRGGDGRAVLRSSIREFLCSEAMAGLGIATTRALALVSSPDSVLRESVETAAVVLRVAPSFIRFGHFEHFAAQRDISSLKALADFVIKNYYPACQDAKNPYAALLEEVAHCTAETIAQWQCVGFMHGVMNTDNMSILGLTIDYGPFGFMDHFNAGHICNHSDHQGRYSYYQQPQVAHWNIAALAQALSPLIDDPDAASAAVQSYVDSFETSYTDGLRAKLGLETSHDGDATLLNHLIQLLHTNQPDWTIFFRSLSQVRAADASKDAAVRDQIIDRPAADAWLSQYRQRLQAEASPDNRRAQAMNRVNPNYILRNYLAENVIRQTRDAHDTSALNTLLKLLRHPFDQHAEQASYAAPPPDWAKQLSVSCSS